jgi:hypothetical protein
MKESNIVAPHNAPQQGSGHGETIGRISMVCATMETWPFDTPAPQQNPGSGETIGRISMVMWTMEMRPLVSLAMMLPQMLDAMPPLIPMPPICSAALSHGLWNSNINCNNILSNENDATDDTSDGFDKFTFLTPKYEAAYEKALWDSQPLLQQYNHRANKLQHYGLLIEQAVKMLHQLAKLLLTDLSRWAMDQNPNLSSLCWNHV